RTRVGLEADRDAVAGGGHLLVERAQDPELRPAARAAVADALRELHVTHQAERLGHAVVEALGLGDVVAADGEVAEHGRPPGEIRMPRARKPPQAGAIPAGRTG